MRGTALRRTLLVFVVLLQTLGSVKSEPYLGQLLIFAFDASRSGFAKPEGQTLPINTNQPLFALLGTQYGGNGQNTFGLPDLRNRTFIGSGCGIGLTCRDWGTLDGQNSYTLSSSNIPISENSNIATYVTSDPDMTCSSATTNALVMKSVCPAETNPSTTLFQSTPGTATPIDNRMSSLSLYYFVATAGAFPSRAKSVQPEDEEVEEEHDDQQHALGRNKREYMDTLTSISAYLFDFVPSTELACDGAVIAINKNQALFALIGLNYGGGINENSFALPDLRGRVPVGSTDASTPGTMSGADTKTFTRANIAAIPNLKVSTAVSSNKPRFCGSSSNPAIVALPDGSSCSNINHNIASGLTLESSSYTPPTNMQQYVALTFGFAKSGVFPGHSKRGMPTAIIGQMFMFAGNFAPVNFLLCDGASYSAVDPNYVDLFNLIGYTYGGNSNTQTFQVPDMRNTVPIGQSTQVPAGTRVGSNSITLTRSQVASAAPTISAKTFSRSSPKTDCGPSNVDAFQVNDYCYDESVFTIDATVSNANQPDPVDNQQPTLAINWLIAYKLAPTK